VTVDLAMAKVGAVASNGLGFDLGSLFFRGMGNAIYSPASITAALAMAASGARGETLKEMRAVLHADAVPDTDGSFASLLASINGRDGHDGVEVHSASRLWGQQGLELEEAFMHGALSAPFEEVDFLHNPDAACSAVNEWVSGATNGHIPTILERRQCRTPDLVLVLANAMYFKGRWVTPFEKAKTKNLPFYTPTGRSIQVPTMHGQGNLPYAHVGGVQVVSIPYLGGLSMIVALPDDRTTLVTVEHELPARHAAWANALKGSSGVELWLPRWTATSDYDLVPMLKQLGMRRAFENRADFSGISQTRLKVSFVVHKALVAVDEAGTEAAAATATGMVLIQGDTIRVLDPIVFRADHPFLYFIEDSSTGAVLFAGRVTDPR
jgi:serpin B